MLAIFVEIDGNGNVNKIDSKETENYFHEDELVILNDKFYTILEYYKSFDYIVYNVEFQKDDITGGELFKVIKTELRKRKIQKLDGKTFI